MISLNASSLVALIVLARFVNAADVPRVPKDPQSGYEPRSQSGAGQQFLKKFVGDWTVVKKFYPRSGEPVETAGTCRQTMIHEGRFLQSEFVFEQGEKKTTGLGIIGFEAESGKFTSFWTDSRSTRMSVRQSEDKFNGDEIVLYSRSLGPSDTAARRSRTVTRLEGDGRKIEHRQYTVGQDGKERLIMELMMSRKIELPKASQ